MDLVPQTNIISSICHNQVARMVSTLSRDWIFDPKGILIHKRDRSTIQIKTTSDGQIKRNRISTSSGYYIVVKYTRQKFTLLIDEILLGFLDDSDWSKSDKTQFAFITKKGASKLKTIYPKPLDHYDQH